jgi:Leucine-rich repeat (LRR) protein
LQEAERLSVLPRLLVLDLAGNPLVSATDGYRLLMLYKLKVLDGIAADATELAAAQAQHAGRLTVGMLVSCLDGQLQTDFKISGSKHSQAGHDSAAVAAQKADCVVRNAQSPECKLQLYLCAMQEQQLASNCDLSALKYLDLSSMGIKDLGSVFAAGGPLAGLTWLNLDSNHLTSLAPLAGLTRLVALSINNNRPWTARKPAGPLQQSRPLALAQMGKQGSTVLHVAV